MDLSLINFRALESGEQFYSWFKMEGLPLVLGIRNFTCPKHTLYSTMSTAEKYNPKPAFFHLFCMFFPIVFWQISLCFCNAFFLASFSPFSPLTLQKVKKNSEICCRLSITEKCNPQPFFPFVLLKFSWFLPWFLMGFGSFFAIIPLVFT